MVIDFHTHIFPDKIAGKTIEMLEEVGGIKAFTDGTLNGLKKSMLDNNINISVVLPVVTKPSQFDTVNSYAAEITGKEGIISFGGIHPDNEDFREKLEQIQKMGLLGIKLHPDYQETFIDDPKMVQIIKYAANLGLIVLIHAGLDIGLPDPIHCPPQKAADMLSQLDNESAQIILAHTGGYDMWKDVEEYLVGKNVWIDISYSLGKISDEQFVRIVKNHGADRVLFATDSPWGGQKETLEYIRNLDFTEEELDRMLWRNAEELLGLS
ncbi:MAG: TatD family hydrolase [Herbinix sp.]|nr:TatD family hydrolase [Herbinix sp.]